MRQATCFDDLLQSVSLSRLRLYGAGKGPEAEVCARYLWNVALSEALYPAFNHVEVALRNAFHREASVHRKSAMWFLGTRPDGARLLLDREWGQVEKARNDLVDRGKPITPGGIIAELQLGFWTALFYKPYASILYAPIAQTIFPGATNAQIRRPDVEKRLRCIREFRNRVFHHEPIWNRPTLIADHVLILETIEWMSPALHATVAMLDRFPGVLTSGVSPYQTQYATWVATLPP